MHREGPFNGVPEPMHGEFGEGVCFATAEVVIAMIILQESHVSVTIHFAKFSIAHMPPMWLRRALPKPKGPKGRAALAVCYLGAQLGGGEEIRRLRQPVSDQGIHQRTQCKTALAARLGVNQAEGLP